VNLLVCVLLLLLNLLCSGFGELTGVDNTTSNVQHESATPSIDEINIFPFDSGVSGNEKVDYPVVNKCCPFLTRYENGVCIKLHNNSDASSGEEDEFRPSGPIITLTKDSEGLNMTDIYGEPVNFRYTTLLIIFSVLITKFPFSISTFPQSIFIICVCPS